MVINIDSTVVCNKPKISPYAEKIRDNIADVIGIAPERVSIKAKTEEGLGFTGTGEGVKAYAVAMIKGI